MLSALSAAKKRTQPPLRPTDIRSIHVIRDLLIHFRLFSSFRLFSELLKKIIHEKFVANSW